MNLREQLPETFRAIDAFNRLIFGSPVPRVEAIRWVHQQLEQACEPVPPLKSEVAQWERELAHNRVTAYSDMASSDRRTVDEIVEDQRPRPSWVYRPWLIPRPDKQPPALCDFVLNLCVLHDGIGYPESPLKPERPVNEMLNWRWSDCWEQGFDDQPCPLPEDRPEKWTLKPLLSEHLERQIGLWIRQVDAAFRKNFGLPAEPARSEVNTVVDVAVKRKPGKPPLPQRDRFKAFAKRNPGKEVHEIKALWLQEHPDEPIKPSTARLWIFGRRKRRAQNP